MLGLLWHLQDFQTFRNRGELQLPSTPSPQSSTRPKCEWLQARAPAGLPGVPRTYLDPLVWPDVVEGDDGVRSVQQHLVTGVAGVVAGADADGHHPVGTLLGWASGGGDTSQPPHTPGVLYTGAGPGLGCYVGLGVGSNGPMFSSGTLLQV